MWILAKDNCVNGWLQVDSHVHENFSVWENEKVKVEVGDFVKS